MKEKIHPKYVKCAVKCGCGNTFETRSTRESISLDICSQCHPFFTGKVKFVDAAGRVEKFQQKYKQWAQQREAAKKGATKGPES